MWINVHGMGGGPRPKLLHSRVFITISLSILLRQSDSVAVVVGQVCWFLQCLDLFVNLWGVDFDCQNIRNL